MDFSMCINSQSVRKVRRLRSVIQQLKDKLDAEKLNNAKRVSKDLMLGYIGTNFRYNCVQFDRNGSCLPIGVQYITFAEKSLHVELLLTVSGAGSVVCGVRDVVPAENLLIPPKFVSYDEVASRSDTPQGETLLTGMQCVTKENSVHVQPSDAMRNGLLYVTPAQKTVHAEPLVIVSSAKSEECVAPVFGTLVQGGL